MKGSVGIPWIRVSILQRNDGPDPRRIARIAMRLSTLRRRLSLETYMVLLLTDQGLETITRTEYNTQDSIAPRARLAQHGGYGQPQYQEVRGTNGGGTHIHQCTSSRRSNRHAGCDWLCGRARSKLFSSFYSQVFRIWRLDYCPDNGKSPCTGSRFWHQLT